MGILIIKGYINRRMTFTLTKEQAEELVAYLRMVLSSLDTKNNEKILVYISENKKNPMENDNNG